MKKYLVAYKYTQEATTIVYAESPEHARDTVRIQEDDKDDLIIEATKELTCP